jgi:eukaryotic-like serine/threonine-protein kinase
MSTPGERRMRNDKPLDETAPSPTFVELERFGDYRLIGSLAKGGMAELYLAVQTGMEGFSRVVALKRVLPNSASNPAFVQMFLDEARLAARLDHPNIVRIYDFGQEQGTWFMAMEYLPGEDLRHVVGFANAGGVLIAPELAASIVERAAEALHFAHELTDAMGAPLGLVHRDVNPSNVLLTYTGHVKVVDFGIAKAASNVFQTEAGALKGKLGYLAPEQLASSPLDRRCDVFGLGIILWELLSGQYLFQRQNYAATIAAAHEGIVPSLHALREDVDEELEAIANIALARDPAARFQTAAQMQEALEQYLRNRHSRPTERDLAQWMEALGGERRAQLKRSIARGTQVLSSYNELEKLAPVTGAGVRSADPETFETPPRPLWQVALFALGALVLAGTATWFVSPSGPAPVVEARSSAQIDSDPPGAFIFANGEPTGRVTPATFSGLDPSKPLVVRLEKPGYAPFKTTLDLEKGKSIARRFSLVAVKALVSFSNVPPGGTVRVDGNEIDLDELLELNPGKARLDVTMGGKVIVHRELDLLAGPQTIDLSP